MRHDVKILILLFVAGLTFTNCAKDELEQASTDPSSNSIQKSGFSNIEKLGMAANIQQIEFISGKYVVSFYGSSDSYAVYVDGFQPEIGFELTILNGTSSTSSILDLQDRSLDIEGDRIYTLTELDSSSVSSGSDVLFRVTLGVIAQHIESPGNTITFDDNGNSDAVPDSPLEGRCFWCTLTNSTTEFYPGVCVDNNTTYMFWGLWQSSSQSDHYAC